MLSKVNKTSVDCNICHKSFTTKNKWYLKHVSSCNDEVSKAILSDSICVHCGKRYVSKKWFTKHTETCKSKLSTLDALRNIEYLSSEEVIGDVNKLHEGIFSFNDEFFNQIELKLVENVSFESNDWLNTIESSINPDKFNILHLNINSIFNKFEHVFTLLNELNLDIIALNEIKLDDTQPDKYYEHSNYQLRRRNRNAYGGGIMVYVKNCYTISEYEVSMDFELLSFKLIINNVTNKFIFTYKPPCTRNDIYIDHLDSVLSQCNLNESLFVIGDINMDWLTVNGSKLKELCGQFELINFITQPTRSASTKKGESHTIIDVVLHNKKHITNTNVVDFPYSDHKIILVECNYAAQIASLTI